MSIITPVKIALFLISAILLAACASGTSQEDVPMSGLTAPAISFNINDGTCPDLEIQAGSMVGWKNTGTKEFSLQSEPQENGQRLFDAGTLQPGDEFRMTFVEPGTVRYHCSGDGPVFRTITITDPNG